MMKYIIRGIWRTLQSHFLFKTLQPATSLWFNTWEGLLSHIIIMLFCDIWHAYIIVVLCCYIWRDYNFIAFFGLSNIVLSQGREVDDVQKLPLAWPP